MSGPQDKDVDMDKTLAKPSNVVDQKKSKKEQLKDEEELSEEDMKLKEDLELLVSRLMEPDQSLYEPSLSQLKEYIRNSTSSMTAVPKPLKFLRPFYPKLTELYTLWTSTELKSLLADVLSVLSTTYSDNGKHDSLKYRCLSQEKNIEQWGHEYIRHLALEIGEVYGELILEEAELEENENDDETVKLENESSQSAEKPATKENTAAAAAASEKENEDEKELAALLSEEFSKDDLLALSYEIVPYFLKHNGEADAVDLLSEVEHIHTLPQFVDADTFERVCHYMVSCVPLLPQQDATSFLQTAYSIYLSENRLSDALFLAVRLDDENLISQVFDAANNDPPMKKQLAYILSGQHSFFQKDEEVNAIIGNTKQSEHFQYLVKELNLLTPKVPEDIYKSHLETSGPSFGSGVDSAQQNLAASFVNGYLNMGYCNDKLVLNDDNWVYKTKGDGMTSTVASIGAINQWNLDGLQYLDKYLYVEEPEIKAGALLGTGLAACGVHDGDVEPALLLLQDYIESSNPKISTAAILGLGISFAGSKNDELLGLLLPLVEDVATPIQTSAVAALALGHAFVGTCNGDITSAIMDNLLERTDVELKTEWTRFLSLALGLLYLGMGYAADDVLETITAIDHPIMDSIEVLVMSCAFAGSGDVLLVQDLLHKLTPKLESTLEDGEEVEDEEDFLDEGPHGFENAPVPSAPANEDQAEEGQSDNATAPKGTSEEMEVDETQASPEKETKKAENADESKTEDTEEDKAEKELGKADESIFSVFGIAMVAMGESIGKEMSLRHFGHLMHYGNEHVKKAVPLAMAMLSTSNPEIGIFETLSRYSHDEDLDVASNAIYSMGLCGAGTNNARLAQLLRNLASYYSNSQNMLFITRLAQGLVHLGKGTLTLDIYNDAQIMNKGTLASLLTVMVGLSSPTFMIDHHYLFYYLNAGIRPKYIIALNEDEEPIKVNVRVGQAVDTVGQAGKPKTITGWITHSTPVLLNHGERAELESNEYISLSSKIEGVVILKKNPDFKQE